MCDNDCVVSALKLFLSKPNFETFSLILNTGVLRYLNKSPKGLETKGTSMSNKTIKLDSAKVMTLYGEKIENDSLSIKSGVKPVSIKPLSIKSGLKPDG
jgi:hypothetical protein